MDKCKDHMQAQILLLKEDLAAESREKDRFKNKLSEVERELRITKALLSNYSTEQVKSFYDRRQEALRRYGEEHGTIMEGEYEAEGDYDEIDYPMSIRKAAA